MAGGMIPAYTCSVSGDAMTAYGLQTDKTFSARTIHKRPSCTFADSRTSQSTFPITMKRVSFAADTKHHDGPEAASQVLERLVLQRGAGPLDRESVLGLLRDRLADPCLVEAEFRKLVMACGRLLDDLTAAEADADTETDRTRHSVPLLTRGGGKCVKIHVAMFIGPVRILMDALTGGASVDLAWPEGSRLASEVLESLVTDLNGGARLASDVEPVLRLERRMPASVTAPEVMVELTALKKMCCALECALFRRRSALNLHGMFSARQQRHSMCCGLDEETETGLVSQYVTLTRRRDGGTDRVHASVLYRSVTVLSDSLCELQRRAEQFLAFAFPQLAVGHGHVHPGLDVRPVLEVSCGV